MHAFELQRGIISGVQATAAVEHEPASNAICKLATALLEIFDEGDVLRRPEQTIAVRRKTGCQG